MTIASHTGPHILVGVRCGHRVALPDPARPRWRLGETMQCCACAGLSVAIVCAADAGQQEDLDALPVREQAAIIGSIFASDDHVTWDDVCEVDPEDGNPTGEDARLLVEAMPTSHRDRDYHWAAAEARIRAGEVR